MSSAYTDHHLPLDPESRFIRVFDLQPSHFGTEEEPIRGHLRVVCLDNNPSYAAISYAWRTTLPSGHIADEPSLHIACGADESLPVTANCYDALQQLRLSFRTRTLWVDSICVDQSNKKERSHQVLLMRDIYSQAQKVYIWLGKGTQDSDDAMDWLADATLDVSPLTLIRISAFPEFLVRRRDIARICRMFLEQIRVCKLSFHKNFLLGLEVTD
jgi:hypothetical protein